MTYDKILYTLEYEICNLILCFLVFKSNDKQNFVLHIDQNSIHVIKDSFCNDITTAVILKII